jgi:hypothetical protein
MIALGSAAVCLVGGRQRFALGDIGWWRLVLWVVSSAPRSAGTGGPSV